ncbi:MAG: BadF/BadG/BcrA/BcrD ATPase family protein [Terriglobales bacterium]
MEFVLGIDGGGTKTEFVVAPRRAGATRRVWAGGSSLSRRSEAEVAAELERGCRRAWEAAGAAPEECSSVCGGFASVGAHAAFYEQVLARLLPRARVRVMTDAELALYAASGGGDGIVVISGTGSIAWGCYTGKTVRVGGLGPGQDLGSGDWIGREAVRAGMAEAPERDDFAALIPELAGAPAAEGIFRRAGAELAALLLTCARELAWSAPAAYYAGGVLMNVALVRSALAEAWPHSLAPLPCPPAEAAAELARADQ